MPLLHHNEPIWREGVWAAHIPSGMFGQTLGSAIELGDVAHPDGVTDAFIRDGSFEIETAGQRHTARATSCGWGGR